MELALNMAEQEVGGSLFIETFSDLIIIVKVLLMVFLNIEDLKL